MNCSAECRRTPGCGRTLTRGVGRAASTSPSSSKVHRTGHPGRRSLLARGVVQLALLLSAAGLALSPWGGVVFVRGQEHLQRELLMPPVRP